jgi:hypothetical protein
MSEYTRHTYIGRLLYLKVILDKYSEMAFESDTDYVSVMTDPYRDDPVWEDCLADAVDVQGGPDDDTTSCSEEEDESEEGSGVTFPDTCVCQNCRCVFFLDVGMFFT